MAENITLTNLVNLTNETSAVTAINDNNDIIVDAFQDVLSRSGTSPNAMESTLDMNSNRIINLPNAISNTEPITLSQLTNTLVSNGNITLGTTNIPVSAAMQPVVDASTTSSALALLGAVAGPSGAVSGDLAIFSGTSGTIISDSGTTLSSALADYVVGPTTAVSGHLAVFSGSSGTIIADGGTVPVTPTVAPLPGAVYMYYTGSSWTVNTPTGGTVNISASTTDGLQEAINYSMTAGYPLVVNAPGATQGGSNVATIECTTPITIGPMNGWNMTVKNAVIDFPSTATGITGACITIGTLSFCSVDLDCTVQSAAPNAAYLVQAVNNGSSQPSSNPYIQDNYIHLRTLIAYGGALTGVLNFDGVTYSIQNNYIRSEIIDSGGFATFGIVISNPVGAQSGFVQNIIDVGLVVSSKQTEVQVGTSTVTTPLGANVWRFGGITPSQSGMASALTTYAIYDQYNIGSVSINAGSCTTGIDYGSGSKMNFTTCGQNDITVPVTDSGTHNTYFMGLGSSTIVKLGIGTASTGTAGQLYSNSGVVTLS